MNGLEEKQEIAQKNLAQEQKAKEVKTSACQNSVDQTSRNLEKTPAMPNEQVSNEQVSNKQASSEQMSDEQIAVEGKATSMSASISTDSSKNNKIPNNKVSNSKISNSKISHEDKMRAEIYSFIAGILLKAPDADRLSQLALLEGNDTPLGQSFALFSKLAKHSNACEAQEEYNALFIGMGRGELLPYASYYLTGFLNEKPLAKLRNTMKELGIARLENVKEPEDHMGSLMEMMAGLIMGELGASQNEEGQMVPISLERQQAFFETHIAPWAAYFFQDLERAKGAKLYQPLGTIGRLFVEIESNAFEML